MSEPENKFLTHAQRAELAIADHRQRLKVLFKENEERISSDTALRGVLLDADRFADELTTVLAATPRCVTCKALDDEYGEYGAKSYTVLFEENKKLRAAPLLIALLNTEGPGKLGLKCIDCATPLYSEPKLGYGLKLVAANAQGAMPCPTCGPLRAVLPENP